MSCEKCICLGRVERDYRLGDLIAWCKSKRQVVTYEVGCQHYQSAQQSVHPTVATVATPEVESTTRNSG